MKKQREAVIHIMQQFAKYVELNCKNDMGIFQRVKARVLQPCAAAAGSTDGS